MDQGQKKSGVLLTISLCSTKGPLEVSGGITPDTPPLVRFFLEKKGGIWSKIFLLGISLLKNFPALRAGGK